MCILLLSSLSCRNIKTNRPGLAFNRRSAIADLINICLIGIMRNNRLRTILEDNYRLFCVPSFIENDPVQIPHRFTRKEDIEISAFLTSTIAWGNRKSIIASASKMMTLMDDSPYEFVMKAGVKEMEQIRSFAHRTFQGIDFTFFIRSLHHIYSRGGGLEKVFTDGYRRDRSVRGALMHFREVFFETEHPLRTLKHVSDVGRNSAGKRLNLFLMWMVRRDKGGVHFGLWRTIPPSALHIPLDVHCGNVARSLGLLTRTQNDWKAVEELTAALREFDPEDPVKYDFALFCMGVNRIIKC